MLVGDNPSGTSPEYAAGRAIVGGTPVSTSFDFLFREGTSSQPGLSERGIMEFATPGITASSVINSVYLQGTIGLLQNSSPAAVSAGFYAYVGNGQINTADA